MENDIIQNNDIFIKSAAFFYASSSHGRMNWSLYEAMVKALIEEIKPNSGKKELLK